MILGQERGKAVFVVGAQGTTHIGGSLRRAANRDGFVTIFCDTDEAYGGSRWLQRVKWHLCGRRPARMAAFEAKVLGLARNHKPEALIATGQVPLRRSALRLLASCGVRCVNYSTDDPWNPATNAAWFQEALSEYATVFTPRRANLDELRGLGCQDVRYLPFGYDDELFYPEPIPNDLRQALQCDVLFVGGADRDRVPMLRHLNDSELKIGIYGAHWDRHDGFTSIWRGCADADTLRRATLAACVNLCLVRRANRDGHVMRSMEIAACGGCMLAEDTAEHRALFGEDGDCVRYFSDAHEMTSIAKDLVVNPQLRQQLGSSLRARVSDRHRYLDRLRSLIGSATKSGFGDTA